MPRRQGLLTTVDAASRRRRIRAGSLIPILGMRPDLCSTGAAVRPVLNTVPYTITADIYYSHVAPVQQREAADKLGQAIHW